MNSYFVHLHGDKVQITLISLVYFFRFPYFSTEVPCRCCCCPMCTRQILYILFILRRLREAHKSTMKNRSSGKNKNHISCEKVVWESVDSMRVFQFLLSISAFVFSFFYWRVNDKYVFSHIKKVTFLCDTEKLFINHRKRLYNLCLRSKYLSIDCLSPFSFLCQT